MRTKKWQGHIYNLDPTLLLRGSNQRHLQKLWLTAFITALWLGVSLSEGLLRAAARQSIRRRNLLLQNGREEGGWDHARGNGVILARFGPENTEPIAGRDFVARFDVVGLTRDQP